MANDVIVAWQQMMSPAAISDKINLIDKLSAPQYQSWPLDSFKTYTSAGTPFKILDPLRPSNQHQLLQGYLHSCHSQQLWKTAWNQMV